MSYSAFVSCNCYQEGKATAPPFPANIQISEEGLYLQTPEGLWEKDQTLVYEMDTTFDRWKQSACAHPDMRFASEYLSNNSGMGNFKQIVHALGGIHKFPILTAYLPTSNSGTLPAAFADKVLLELKLLETEMVPDSANPIGKEFAYMIGPLKKLAAASLETDNPIIWT